MSDIRYGRLHSTCGVVQLVLWAQTSSLRTMDLIIPYNISH